MKPLLKTEELFRVCPATYFTIEMEQNWVKTRVTVEHVTRMPRGPPRARGTRPNDRDGRYRS